MAVSYSKAGLLEFKFLVDHSGFMKREAIPDFISSVDDLAQETDQVGGFSSGRGMATAIGGWEAL